jgi:hypothetical protein
LIEDLSLPQSDYSKQKKKRDRKENKSEIIISSSWRGARLPSPFLLNKNDIFSAMDVILRDTSIMAFDH